MNEKCRVSGKRLIEVIDFGEQPLGNGFLKQEQFGEEYFFNMRVGFCEESGLLQLFDQPSPEAMFHEEYAFFSSTSTEMSKHFKSWAKSVATSSDTKNPLVIEIGCNDGIFLENFVNTNIRTIGIEPSENVANIAKSKGVMVENSFMNIPLAEALLSEHGSADYITAANVICHIPNILELAKCIDILLSDNGKFIFEEPYLGDIIQKCAYDQIYDEHVFLFSCISVKNLFNKLDLELIDAQPQVTHGGSMRYTIGRKGFNDVSDNAKKILENEYSMGLNKIESMLRLSENIKQSKNKLVEILENLKSGGSQVCGYAATSKSTTILNYCNIGPDLIQCIYDTTPLKQGKFSPGMHIPITDWKEFNLNMPDYTFLFAWNHLKEIMAKERAYTSQGRKWITHIPTVQIS
ncbi:SAM-dependent methyltransferase [Synechococcus sp. BL107]|nr:SAM-dependent methyltransferase [Synechococcus sp. BL107]